MKIGEPVETIAVKHSRQAVYGPVAEAMQLVPAHLSLPVEFDTVIEANRAILATARNGSLGARGIGGRRRGTVVYFYWREKKQ